MTVYTNGSYSSMVKAQTQNRIEQVLSNLTSAQRQAIKQLKISDQSGLQLSPEVDLTSDNLVSVIVEFKDKPQKTAMLEAAADGKTLSPDEAKAKVDASHEKFENDLKSIFQKELQDKKDVYSIKHSYKNAFNGVAISLPANKIKALLTSSAVKTVWSDSAVQVELPVEESSQSQSDSHTRVTFPGIQKLHDEGYTGKGVKIGIIDTGIDYNHQDLKDAFKGGYDFVDKDNDPMETTYTDWQKSGMPELRGGEAYYTEHGTHVAGIIAGQGKNSSADTPVEGVAPDADIYSYRVLGPYGSGSTSAIIAGIDKAVSDGMDIISMSLGANYNDPMAATSIAVNNAVIAGVTAVVAAGNSGDRMYTLGSPGTSPLAITVGASDTSVSIPTYTGTAHSSTGDIPVDMKLTASGPADKIADFQNQTLKMVNVSYGGEANYWMGAPGKSAPIDVTGKVVLAQRGSFSIAKIVTTAKAHGAKAVVLYNAPNDTLSDVFLDDGYGYIPTFLINNSQGVAIAAKLHLSPEFIGTSLDFTFGKMNQIVTKGDQLASFSSRGPSRVLYDIKPEVTAPGVSVYSTVPSYMHGPSQIGNYQYAYEPLSGTSMATPNVSGVVALLKQAHPDMTPADLKATLMNTADPLNGDFSVYEVGAGRVNPYKAVHAETEIEVKDRTDTVKDSAAPDDNGMFTLANKGVKTIKNITGALSFGEVAVNGKDLSDKRTVTIFNNSNETKTYQVKVEFQTLNGRSATDSRKSNDAAANNVTLDVDHEITVKKNSKREMNIKINVPQMAKLGTYEGYVVYTNKDNPDESYKLPFAIHTLTGSVYDKEVDEMNAGGIHASQGDNKMFYQAMSGRGGTFSIPVSSDGKFTANIPVSPLAPSAVDFWAVDKSSVKSYADIKDLYFVKQGVPYGTAIADKRNIKMGDTVTVALSMNHMTNMKQAVFTYTYDPQYLNLVSIKPHAGLEEKVDIQTANVINNYTRNALTITATLKGDLATTGLSGNVPLVDVTYKATEIYFKGPIMFNGLKNGRFFNATYTNTDGNTVSTFGVQPYFYITPTHSILRGGVSAEGLMFFSGLGPEMKELDYLQAGAKVKVTDADGKSYPATFNTSTSQYFFTANIPITDKPFTLQIDVPGHFTFKKVSTIGLNVDGQIVAGSKPVDYNYIPGGDVNKDNVIDINDALLIEKNWNTNNRDADINYDGVVDEKDMKYVVDNYLMQNPWLLDKAPEPEKKYKGKTLEDVLHEVGM